MQELIPLSQQLCSVSYIYRNIYEHIANALALSEYCEDKYGEERSHSKCGEESIRLLKQQLVIAYVYIYICVYNINLLYTL